MKRKKINIITLGCSKNLVDSEVMMSQLKNSGFTVVHNSDSLDCPVVAINTCGFIGDAKEESIETILQYVDLKNRGVIEELFVFGCLSERYRDELVAEIPEVDDYFGVKDLSDVVKRLGAKYREELLSQRVLTTPPHYAYLKVSEGCNWRCSYCAIPLIRGKHVSRTIESLVEEAKFLANKGVKELMLIAQDLTYYGKDLYGERQLAQLVRELCKVDGIEWIRLHYAYPAQFPKDVIEVMKTEPKVCNYIDIPFQHVSTNVLDSMRRGIDKAETVKLMDFFRSEVPDIAIRTTLIVGYPNETVENFDELQSFVKESRFDRLGAFAYSQEENTFAATLDDSVTEEEKERRRDVIMSIQSEIALNNNQKYKDTWQRVIIDREEGEFFVGRTQYDSPEVDNEVLIKTDKNMTVGEFYDVRITDVDIYDLYAEF